MIFGFMHVYPVNNWQEIVERQLTKINKSGMLNKTEKLFVGINGNDGNWIGSLSDKIEILYQVDKPELEQSLTLSFLYMFAKADADNSHFIYYTHTKGVTHLESKPQSDWCKMMEYFIIMKHETCIKELHKSDVVGINWHLGEGYMGASSKKCGGIKVGPHFSGNFWWATSEYLKKLPSLYPLISKYQCEFWIGSGNPRVSELWHSGIHHHRKPYPESKYIDRDCEIKYYGY